VHRKAHPANGIAVMPEKPGDVFIQKKPLDPTRFEKRKEQVSIPRSRESGDDPRIRSWKEDGSCERVR
jgi:hypothetical protein